MRAPRRTGALYLNHQKGYAMPYPQRDCPSCKRYVARTAPGVQRFGPFLAHRECSVRCSLCEEQLQPPGLGQGQTLAAYCGEPAHRECKEAAQAEIETAPTAQTDLGTSASRKGRTKDVTTPKRGPGGRMAGIRRLEQGRQSGGKFGWGPRA